MKLGKQAAAPERADFRWRRLAASLELPLLPARFGHASMFGGAWGMYGNDRYGDCVWAGAAHEHRMFGQLIHRVDLPFTTAAVLSDYAAATGFDPADPSTDQGSDVHQALAYRRRTGIVDGAGARHKIGAYVSLDPKNWSHLLEATYIFGAVGIGFEFPAFAFDQFDRGQAWDVVAADGGIEGGHYVCVLGAPSTGRAACITWGKRQVLTRAFYERYNDEAWAYVTSEALHSDGSGLHGFNLDRLNQYLAQLAA